MSGNYYVVESLLRDHGAAIDNRTAFPYVALGVGAGFSAIYAACSVCPTNIREIMQVWRGVVWRGAAWCGVVWCSVVWCGVYRMDTLSHLSHLFHLLSCFWSTVPIRT